jgi:predicted NBD/HSP70 family sugar kinase
MAEGSAPGSSSPSLPLRAAVGARNEQTRRHNLSALLTHVHHNGALTRAELTRRTGLNRSTTGALVADLAANRLVHETRDDAHAGVGRPSPRVHPNPNIVALAINPDVDALIIGVVGLGGVVHRRVRHATSVAPTAAQTIKLVRRLLGELRPELDRYSVVGVGLAIPGLVRAADGQVALAPHLGWRDEPLAKKLEDAIGYSTVAGNDANVGMIAETLFGAGRAVSDLVYLNGSSSGIGAGVLVEGRPLAGARGFAAELGHTLIDSRGEACHCGKRGCLETEVNLARLLAVIGQKALDADELDFALSRASGRALRQEMRRQVDLLGEAIAGFVSVFDPELVLLGGFLGSLYGAMPDRLQQRVEELCLAPLAGRVRIERALLRSRLLMVGAAELAFKPLLADPLDVAARLSVAHGHSA